MHIGGNTFNAIGMLLSGAEYGQVYGRLQKFCNDYRNIEITQGSSCEFDPTENSGIRNIQSGPFAAAYAKASDTSLRNPETLIMITIHEYDRSNDPVHGIFLTCNGVSNNKADNFLNFFKHKIKDIRESENELSREIVGKLFLPSVNLYTTKFKEVYEKSKGLKLVDEE